MAHQKEVNNRGRFVNMKTMNQVVELDVNLNDSSKQFHYQGKQMINYASLLKKLAKNEPITIVCQGDSMTYGQDTISEDRRSAKSDPTCESAGVYSDDEQAGITYPEALQTYCDEIFGKEMVKVINRGFSGDWAEESKARWSSNPEADLHFVMLGTNDSCTYPYVPTNVQQNLVKYMKDMCELVEQILDFGSAVVLLTPPKHSIENDLMRIAFRNALTLLGERYHIPVVNTADFLKSYPYQDVQSDAVHYNSFGYKIMGVKIAGILASISSIYQPLTIHSNQIIIPSFDEFGIAFKNNGVKQVTLEEDILAPNGIGSSSFKGLRFHLFANTRMTFSFFSEEDNVMVIPLFEMGAPEAKLTIEIDFGMDLGTFSSPYLFRGFKKEDIPNYPLTSRLIYKGCVSRINIYAEELAFTLENSLHLPRKGLYSISVENIGPSDDIYLFGFIVKGNA